MWIYRHLHNFTIHFKTIKGSRGLRIEYDDVEGYGNHWIAVVHVQTELVPRENLWGLGYNIYTSANMFYFK